MIGNAWHYVLYLYGLVIDSLSICDRSDQLTVSRINRTEFPLQYMGSWYFLAAAAEPGTPALDIFKVMDNGQFIVQGSEETEKLEFRAFIRIKDGSCIPRKWIYLLTEDSTELKTEGHPDRLTELFSCHCAKCIILKETDNTTSRFLLYSRSSQLDKDCMDKFKHKSTCEGYKDFLQLPQTLETCPLED